jgi:hypothetical protein
MPKKSPFRTYTSEQILKYEAITYVIVAGTDFYDVNGNYFFNKNGAIRNCNKIYRQLMVQMQSGTKKEQRNARRVLENLRVEPMRIH